LDSDWISAQVLFSCLKVARVFVHSFNFYNAGQGLKYTISQISHDSKNTGKEIPIFSQSA
jgi:esterase/lipase superfamily enzyme